MTGIKCHTPVHKTVKHTENLHEGLRAFHGVHSICFKLDVNNGKPC